MNKTWKRCAGNWVCNASVARSEQCPTQTFCFVGQEKWDLCKVKGSMWTGQSIAVSGNAERRTPVLPPEDSRLPSHGDDSNSCCYCFQRWCCVSGEKLFSRGLEHFEPSIQQNIDKYILDSSFCNKAQQSSPSCHTGTHVQKSSHSTTSGRRKFYLIKINILCTNSDNYGHIS